MSAEKQTSQPADKTLMEALVDSGTQAKDMLLKEANASKNFGEVLPRSERIPADRGLQYVSKLNAHTKLQAQQDAPGMAALGKEIDAEGKPKGKLPGVDAKGKIEEPQGGMMDDVFKKVEDFTKNISGWINQYAPQLAKFARMPMIGAMVRNFILSSGVMDNKTLSFYEAMDAHNIRLDPELDTDPKTEGKQVDIAGFISPITSLMESKDMQGLRMADGNFLTPQAYMKEFLEPHDASQVLDEASVKSLAEQYGEKKLAEKAAAPTTTNNPDNNPETVGNKEIPAAISFDELKAGKEVAGHTLRIQLPNTFIVDGQKWGLKVLEPFWKTPASITMLDAKWEGGMFQFSAKGELGFSSTENGQMNQEKTLAMINHLAKSQTVWRIPSKEGSDVVTGLVYEGTA